MSERLNTPASKAHALQSQAKAATHRPDLRWLLRYARHCKFQTEGGHPTQTIAAIADSDSMAHCLRAAFGAPAWRIVCKSPKSSFFPILRNRELGMDDLIMYCSRLAERSFAQAPAPITLSFFIGQRRYFFDRPCRVPEGEDYEIMRVATRHLHSCAPAGQRSPHSLTLRDMARVVNWAHQTGTAIKPAHQWSKLLVRARQHFEQERVRLASAKQLPWHFFCSDIEWRGHRISPITHAFGLWQQGLRHGNCLYKLRFDCTSAEPSRFFSVSQGGKAVATLELVWRAPKSDFTGMDRVWGRWDLQDLRRPYNRLPDPALLQSMLAFATQYNIWSKRTGRQPAGYVDALIRCIASRQVSTHPRGASAHSWGSDDGSRHLASPSMPSSEALDPEQVSQLRRLKPVTTWIKGAQYL